MFPETFIARTFFRKVSQFENPSMRAVPKILRARASEHSSNFCEQFEQRPNFARTFKFNETIRYPFYSGRDGGGVKISNLCNHRVSKQSKAGPSGAESSAGESTMLSAKFAEELRDKQAGKKTAVPGFEICVFRTPRTRRSMPRQCCGHDCG